MALDFTLAGAQTQLDTVNTAIAAGSWSAAYTAVAAYRLVMAGLAESGGHDGSSLKMPSPDAVARVVEDARRFAALETDRGRRMGRARARHV